MYKYLESLFKYKKIGACSDPRADRTRFIINEDFKLKMEMIPVLICTNKKWNFHIYFRNENNSVSNWHNTYMSPCTCYFLSF